MSIEVSEQFQRYYSSVLIISKEKILRSDL